jgi:hypothetical protein
MRLKAYTWVLVGAWTLVVAASLGWNLFEQKRQTLEMARVMAQINFEKDRFYRRWATHHGGVYVPVSPLTAPNPLLSQVP